MQSPIPSADSSEEARAFLQIRVALFWKVMFFITLLSIGLGSVGLIAEAGVDHLLTMLSGVQSGLFWQLCKRGQRSIRFSRAMESGGLLFNMAVGAFVGRYFFSSFASTESIVTHEGSVMADGFISMLLLCGNTMLLAIRAAVIPSRPRRTILLTALLGVPVILVPALLVPSADGWLTWRNLETDAFPWVPLATMWVFTIITCTIITRVIYGLRAEVREARRLGQYVLEEKIGEGGMGEVYRARHGMMRRPTAIKLLRANGAGETNIRRFEKEVQLTSRLTHPNTITIFDYGRTNDDVFYYAMELLDGATLQRIVETDGPQEASRVVRLLSMACGALSEAHAIGLIHRDIKPANIMLCSQGGEKDIVKVLDFGLVKELDVDDDVGLTGTNTLTGTPQYMSPEAIANPDSVDARSDIYALGAVAYFLLAGDEVFKAKSIVEVCAKHLHEAPESISSRGPRIAADLEAVVMSCLEKDPSRRPQSAADLRTQLEACDVGVWDDGQANSWWSEHGPALHQMKNETSVTKTIAVQR